MAAAREITLAVGPEWIETERARVHAERGGTPDLERHTYLYYRQAHSLVEWILEFERWRTASMASHKFELNEAVLRIFSLGGGASRNEDTAQLHASATPAHGST
jgi:hypothetical protein